MPVPLERLAGYLRDGELVDMRVLHEDAVATLERVCIREINVRKYDEGLLVTQEFVDGEATLRQDIVVEVDNVLWARPTSFELSLVNPIREVKPEPDTLEDTSGILESAWESVADEHDVVLDIPRFRGMVMDGSWASSGKCIDVRHLVVLVVWHTSDMQADRICKLVGYHSQQPFLTAKDKCHVSPYYLKGTDDRAKWHRQRAKNWRAALKRCVGGVLARGGRLRDLERRTDAWAYEG